MFKKDRAGFEELWEDLKVFVDYGMLTDEKFAERSQKFYLYKDTYGNFMTYEELIESVKGAQTDKNDKIIHCKISTLGDVWNLERMGLKYGTRPVYNDKQERTGRRLPHRFPLLVRTRSLPMVRRKDGTDPCATKNQANDFSSKSRFLLYVAFRQEKC